MRCCMPCTTVTKRITVCQKAPIFASDIFRNFVVLMLAILAARVLLYVYAMTRTNKSEIMKTIYRIEHKDTSLGMYMEESIDVGAYLGDTVGTDRHPCPCQDSKLSNKLYAKDMMCGDEWGERLTNASSYNFGFSSKRQLRSWLYDDKLLMFLHNNNFILAVCQCKPSQVIIGNSQAMFIRPEVYEKLSIKEFFNLC